MVDAKQMDIEIRALKRVQEVIPAWKSVELDNLDIKRLSGLSNACYRMMISSDALK